MYPVYDTLILMKSTSLTKLTQKTSPIWMFSYAIQKVQKVRKTLLQGFLKGTRITNTCKRM